MIAITLRGLKIPQNKYAMIKYEPTVVTIAIIAVFMRTPKKAPKPIINNTALKMFIIRKGNCNINPHSCMFF